MKRLSLIGSWKRIGVQLGLLAGIGLAFVGGSQPPVADAAPKNCTPEGDCTFKKPLFGIILDNSSSMNEDFDADTTRWEGAVEAISQAIDFDNGYIAANFILGLMRFGHDPEPAAAGTKIPADTSGLIDGQKLDVPWYDPADPDKKYIECTNGDAINAALIAVGPPSGGNKTGIGTWTKGAMDFAKAYIATSKADHPEDDDERQAILMLVTDGNWTNPQGNQQLAPANQNPAITAADLWMNQTIPTYVVAIGDANGKMFADELAAAGGTTAAIDAVNPQALIDALKSVIETIKNEVIAPVCTPGLPRIMVLMDASSSMLNINGGNNQAPAGQGGWDQARDALAGANSLFDVVLDNGGNKVENLVHLGLSVFGHNQPAEEKLLVQYGPCRKDNFGWALDPASSCEAPGCTDPYAGPPITWTFKDGSVEGPMFDDKTLSHMPKCNPSAGQPEACTGSGTYTHLGLNLIQANIATYKAECSQPMAAQPCNDDTEFLNILVTDGKYNSTDPQVQMPLEAMYNAGITTYVIGFGDAVDVAQLNKMADWGSNATQDYYDANNQDQLEAALKGILENVTFDQCCSFNNCEMVPEPTTNEPDPMIKETESGEPETTTEAESETVSVTTATETDADTDPPPVTTTEEPATDSASTVDPSETDADTGNINTGTGTPTGTGGDEDTNTPTETNPTNPNPTNPNPTGDSTGSGESETEADTVGVDDEGCGCTVDDSESQKRGLLGTLLTFGLAGFMRRRRRA